MSPVIIGILHLNFRDEVGILSNIFNFFSRIHSHFELRVAGCLLALVLANRKFKRLVVDLEKIQGKG